MDTKDRRLIEDSFPVKEVSAESAKEKNIRHGHISSIHLWWSRKPLAVSRAITYATLVPPPNNIDEWEKHRNFIIELCKWENSNDSVLLEKARDDILKANGGIPPKLLDPFAGGGSIPLEALRLGCDTYANDYNPVAVLIEKCTLEYPQEYGKPKDAKKGLLTGNQKNPLLEAVKKWSNWVLNEAKAEIDRFYPLDPDGSVPTGFYWMRTIPCQNPACGANIPLTANYWIVRKNNKHIALYPYVQENDILFKFVGDGYEPLPKDFNPQEGTISHAIAICPACGAAVGGKDTRRLFQEGKSGERMVAVVLTKKNKKGKNYRLATEQDIIAFKKASEYLKKKIPKIREEWGIEPIPDEPTPEGKGRGAERAFSVRNYGLDTWGSLFNARQQLALIVFCEKIRAAYQQMLNEGYEEEFAKAILSYLGLGFDRTLMFTSSLTRWKPDAECPVDIYSRQTLSMAWDYSENNTIFPHSGSFGDQIERILYSSQKIIVDDNPITSIHSSATSLPIPDDYFDAVITDPPYYDNVPYSFLSDFFYVWLKRSMGDLYPDLFSTPLTPKSNEIVAYSTGPGGFEEGKQKFESMLADSFKEIHRILKPNGIAVIVYAHKSTEGWETLINSLLDSGLVITAAWPIHTEMQARLRAKESAALASSIYIVARKWERESTGFYKEVKEELEQHLNKKLDRLWKEEVSGADFYIAAIGSAIEVYGKYTQVMDYEGNIVRADRLLQDVEDIATDYSVKKILKDGFSDTISGLTRFYVIWRWYYGNASVPFDEARKLATSCGLDLSIEWAKSDSFIKKQKENIAVIDPKEREKHLDDLKKSSELIDVLHAVLLLWEKSKQQEILDLLRTSGFGRRDVFFRVAQAISETLPNEAKEKKLLDGFLAGRGRIMEEMRKGTGQQTLF